MVPPPAPAAIARSNRSSTTQGVLAVPAAATKGQAQQILKKDANASKSAAPRLKVVVRRLPPSFTQTELEETLGNEWRVGEGRVDWLLYKPGKISEDPSKHSRASRAYLHLTDQAHLPTLANKVRSSTFPDAKQATNLPSHFGPPSVEFAPYSRIPSKRRVDARQGTIDQDPEFIAFLESLTSPIAPKPASSEPETAPSVKDTKPAVTPLVQFLKDKKANKARDQSSAAKNAKSAHTDSKDGRTPKGSDRTANKAGTGSSPGDRKSKKEDKGSKEVKTKVQLLNREVSSSTNNAKSSPLASQQQNSPAARAASPVPTGPAADRKRERGNAAAAARILQRDLGLAPGAAARRGSPRRGASNVNQSGPESAVGSESKGSVNNRPKTPTDAQSKSPAPGTTDMSPKTKIKVMLSKPNRSTDHNPASAASAASLATASKPPMLNASSGPPTGPKHATARREATVSTTASLASPASPASTSRQAFLKHANPSQGITEPLLTAAMEAFGSVSKVELDKKKGFAYVDFADSTSLQKAMQASPVKVAEGQVVVLERKDKGTGVTTSARGGRAMRGSGGGRGRGRVAPSRGGPTTVASTSTGHEGGQESTGTGA
ncbi:MAG: hypothetical protein M1817_005583 [Caeruleum heppii]|nr:MAG: hypothetical protein M1817_005583 [Caeruleum heppii]